MQAKLYVGNLSYQASEDDLRKLFGGYGAVANATIIRDRFSGQSKGFGFVEMQSGEEAQKALALNGQDFMGRSLTVSEARPPREGGERDSGGGRGGRDRGHGGPRGGGRRFNS